jgi:hypothetical protein
VRSWQGHGPPLSGRYHGGRPRQQHGNPQGRREQLASPSALAPDRRQGPPQGIACRTWPGRDLRGGSAAFWSAGWPDRSALDGRSPRHGSMAGEKTQRGWCRGSPVRVGSGGRARLQVGGGRPPWCRPEGAGRRPARSASRSSEAGTVPGPPASGPVRVGTTVLAVRRGGVMTEDDGQPELTAFQPEVARMFFALPASNGFLLAGGAALLAPQPYGTAHRRPRLLHYPRARPCSGRSSPAAAATRSRRAGRAARRAGAGPQGAGRCDQ